MSPKSRGRDPGVVFAAWFRCCGLLSQVQKAHLVASTQASDPIAGRLFGIVVFRCLLVFRFSMYKYAELFLKYLVSLGGGGSLLAETWEAHLGFLVSWDSVFLRPGSLALDSWFLGIVRKTWESDLGLLASCHRRALG